MDYYQVGAKLPDRSTLVQGPAMPIFPEPSDELASAVPVDMDRLSTAYAISEEAFRVSRVALSDKRKVIALMAIYNALGSATPDQVRLMIDLKTLVPDPPASN